LKVFVVVFCKKKKEKEIFRKIVSTFFCFVRSSFSFSFFCFARFSYFLSLFLFSLFSCFERRARERENALGLHDGRCVCLRCSKGAEKRKKKEKKERRSREETTFSSSLFSDFSTQTLPDRPRRVPVRPFGFLGERGKEKKLT
jgi:hypothetical protein